MHLTTYGALSFSIESFQIQIVGDVTLCKRNLGQEKGSDCYQLQTPWCWQQLEQPCFVWVGMQPLKADLLIGKTRVHYPFVKANMWTCLVNCPLSDLKLQTWSAPVLATDVKLIITLSALHVVITLTRSWWPLVGRNDYLTLSSYLILRGNFYRIFFHDSSLGRHFFVPWDVVRKELGLSLLWRLIRKSLGGPRVFKRSVLCFSFCLLWVAN